MKNSKTIFILMAVCGLMSACDDWKTFHPSECDSKDISTIIPIGNAYYHCTSDGVYDEIIPDCIDLKSHRFETDIDGNCVEKECEGYKWKEISKNQVSCVKVNDQNVGIGECMNGTNSCETGSAEDAFKICVNGQWIEISDTCGCNADSEKSCTEVVNNYGMECGAGKTTYKPCIGKNGNNASCKSDIECGECLNGSKVAECKDDNKLQYKKCESGILVEKEVITCDKGCDKNLNKCIVGECNVGDKICNEDKTTVRVCNENHEWIDFFRCFANQQCEVINDKTAQCEDITKVECSTNESSCSDEHTLKYCEAGHLKNKTCENGQVCQEGSCVEKSKPECMNNNECDDGKVCERGECVEKVCDEEKYKCDENGVPQVCENNKWVSKQQCGDNQGCVDGVCKDNTTGCKNNNECNDGKVCVEGSCVGKSECTTNSECNGKVCKDGGCVECSNNDECGGDKVCEGGVCVDSQSCSTEYDFMRCYERWVQSCNGGIWRISDECPNDCIEIKIKSESKRKAYCQPECRDNDETVNKINDGIKPNYICHNGTYITDEASCSESGRPQCVIDDSASASIHCTNNQWDVVFCEIGCNEDEGRCICSSDDECPEDGGCYTKYEVTMGVCISEGDACDGNDSFCALNNTVLYSCDNGIWNKKECECDQRSNRCSDTHYVVGQRCTNSEETTESDGLTLICLEDQWYELVDNNSNCGLGNSNNGVKCGGNELDVCFSGYCVSTIAKDSEITRCFGGDLIGIKTDESDGRFEIYRCDDQDIGDSVVDKAGKIKKCQTEFVDGIAQSASCVDKCVADSTGIPIDILNNGGIYCHNESDSSNFLCSSNEYNNEFAFYVSKIKTYCEDDNSIKLFSCVSGNDGTFFYNSSQSTPNNCEICSKGICYKSTDTLSSHTCVKCDTSVLTEMSSISNEESNKITNFWCSENTKSIIGVKDVSEQTHLVYCLPDQQCDEGECK